MQTITINEKIKIGEIVGYPDGYYIIKGNPIILKASGADGETTEIAPDTIIKIEHADSPFHPLVTITNCDDDVTYYINSVLQTGAEYISYNTADKPSGGGGSSSAERKQVNFIDYDGTILYSYTAEEAQALTELPANPSHSGLVAQGWNLSLENIKSRLTNVGGDVLVGQMYETESGKTEIDINVDNPVCLSPYLAIAVNGTCTIDWGDGTATDTVTGTSYTTLTFTPHVYATTGRYTISIDGPIGFYCDSASCGALLTDKESLSQRRTYSQYVETIRCANGVYIGELAFNNCYALQSITIPNGVTTIGQYAFSNCNALQSITIPDGVMSIGQYAFYNCYALQSITIPDGVTSIETNAFNGCYALQSITIPDGVTSIGNSAFYNCYALQSITISDSVTSIETQAFMHCYSLQSITIPDGVTSIGTYTFDTCYALRSVTISNSVTSIESGVFQNCYSLQSITIPNGVTSIGTIAFKNCYALQSVTIPNGVESVGKNAFLNCYALRSITIPDSVTSIAYSMFNSCYALQSITIPDGVTSIYGFAFSNCYSIMEYHLHPTTPPTLDTNAFSNIVEGTIIYVPQGSLDAYKTATNWSTYASYMQEEP